MKYQCTKRHIPFEEHNIHWWCFFLANHYTHIRHISETEVITDTPISFWDFIRDEREGDE